MTARGVIYTLAPTTIDFGRVGFGQTKIESFTVGNAGNVTGAFTLTKAGSDRFALSTSTGTVGAGSSSSPVNVTFSYGGPPKTTFDGNVSVATSEAKCAPMPDGSATTGLVLTGRSQ